MMLRWFQRRVLTVFLFWYGQSGFHRFGESVLFRRLQTRFHNEANFEKWTLLGTSKVVFWVPVIVDFFVFQRWFSTVLSSFPGGERRVPPLVSTKNYFWISWIQNEVFIWFFFSVCINILKLLNPLQSTLFQKWSHTHTHTLIKLLRHNMKWKLIRFGQSTLDVSCRNPSPCNCRFRYKRSPDNIITRSWLS